MGDNEKDDNFETVNNTQILQEVKSSFLEMCDEIHNKNDMSLFDAEETYISVLIGVTLSSMI